MSDMMSMMVISGITSIGSAVVSIIGAVKGFHCTKISCCYGCVDCEATDTGASTSNEINRKSLLSIKGTGTKPSEGSTESDNGEGSQKEKPSNDIKWTNTGDTISGMSAKTLNIGRGDRVVTSINLDDADLLNTETSPGVLPPPSLSSKQDNTASKVGRFFGKSKTTIFKV